MTDLTLLILLQLLDNSPVLVFRLLYFRAALCVFSQLLDLQELLLDLVIQVLLDYLLLLLDNVEAKDLQLLLTDLVDDLLFLLHRRLLLYLLLDLDRELLSELAFCLRPQVFLRLLDRLVMYLLFVQLAFLF